MARPPIDALAAERGIPLALHDYAELGLDTLSVAEALRRDPYARPEGFAREFARLAAEGWLEAVEDGGDALATRYVVLPRAREAVRALGEAGDARADELVTMPDADLARTHELLATIAHANLAAPEPPARWASLHRFRTADMDTPLPGRIREAALDCLAYRDDVHLAAWSAHADPATEGGMWNAFTHVWAGEAQTAQAIASAAGFRGYDAAFYARALTDLEARGWVTPGRGDTPLAAGGGAYRTTPEGQALRDAVERQTDEWFFAPWAVLGDPGVAELRAGIERLLGALPILW